MKTSSDFTSVRVLCLFDVVIVIKPPTHPQSLPEHRHSDRREATAEREKSAGESKTTLKSPFRHLTAIQQWIIFSPKPRGRTVGMEPLHRIINLSQGTRVPNIGHWRASHSNGHFSSSTSVTWPQILLFIKRTTCHHNRKSLCYGLLNVLCVGCQRFTSHRGIMMAGHLSKLLDHNYLLGTRRRIFVGQREDRKGKDPQRYVFLFSFETVTDRLIHGTTCLQWFHL